MKTQMIRAMVVALGTMTMAGCGETSRVRPTAEPVTSAAAPATPAPVASACASACPVPGGGAASAAEPPRPAAEPRRAALGADAKLTVRRLVLARGVKDREPVDAGTTFRADGHKVYAFVEIENRGQGRSEIVVEFEPPGGGAPRGDVTLAVGSAPRWRTWAYTRTASTAGSWTAVVKNKKGEVLARTPFEVTL